MNPPPPTAALFGSTSHSTPSATSSTIDSASPNPGPPNAHPHYALMFDPSHPLPSSFLPSYFLGQRNGDFRTGDTGDAIFGLSANALSGAPQPNRTARNQLEDMALPPVPPRAAVPSFFSPPIPGASLPGPKPWLPQDRGPWQEPSIQDVLDDWAGVLDSGGGSRGQVPQPEGSNHAMSVPPGTESPFSVPQPLQRNPHSGVPASPVGDYDYPKSATYPGNLYADLVADGSGWTGGRELSGDACGQALPIYEHLLSSLPHLRPVRSGGDASAPSGLQPLIDLASEGLSLLSAQQGLTQPYIPIEMPPAPPSIPAPQGSGGPQASKRSGGKDKGTTKCLGCGATETPEWRRGPMGPRTLCNACGLVHMKLQRKRKKQEEKAAAAKGDEDGVGGMVEGKTKRARTDEED